MKIYRRSVCIIGAGPSGLVSIKSCLEDGLEPICFEMAGDIGGLWNNEERIRLDQSPKLYPSLVANVSRINSCFSDFPAPTEWTPYLKSDKTLRYYHLYADNFDLRRFITFNTKVVDVTKSGSYHNTGAWVVRTQNISTNEVDDHEYDAIIVATGKFSKQYRPSIPGLFDIFTGKVLHGGDYIGPDQFKGKSVLVIGGGSSGCDIACECSDVAKNVILSARSGMWILPRILNNGLPLDIAVANRFKLMLINIVPSWMRNAIFSRLLNYRMNHNACGINGIYGPTHPLSSFSITDELPLKMYAGQVKTRRGIKRFTDDHVIFEDGRTDAVDIVVMATGYFPHFSFLGKNIFPEELSEARLHKWIFPIDLHHPSTLSFVGIVPNGGGPINTQVELQARFVVQVLSGKRSLPSKSSMECSWEKSRKNLLKQTGGVFVFKMSIFQYQEELAHELGLVPSFWRLVFTDPRLGFKVFFGPFIPYHYRLVGEHAWHKAGEMSHKAIEEAMTGMNSPT